MLHIYGNPTRETNFKVAVNVANPNSLMKKTLVPLSDQSTFTPVSEQGGSMETTFPTKFYFILLIN